jgi:hypothetical protein
MSGRGAGMALTPEHRAALDGLAVEDIRRQLAYAGPGRNSAVPGLGDGMMLRGDVEDHLFERQKTADKAQRRRDILQGVAIGLTALLWAIVSHFF